MKAISDLKWVDDYNYPLSALALLYTPLIHSYLSTAKAFMFLVGTNSVDCRPTSTMLTQIKQFIGSLRSQYSLLMDKQSIHIVTCFPCFKSLCSFNTYHSLLDNTAQYNAQLIKLFTTQNFMLVEFDVRDYHIGANRMHLGSKYNTFVKDSITNYFACLSSTMMAIPITRIGRSREAKA